MQPRPIDPARSAFRLVATLLCSTAVFACGTPIERGISPLVAAGPVTEVPSFGDDDACGTLTEQALMGCVDAARIEADVRFVAQPRPPASAHHEAVADHCAKTLVQHGFDVEQQGYGTGRNVIGVKLGFSRPAEQVVLGAHYDHLAGCEGADDNASGVAVALETARVLSTARFDRTLIVACWDEGERGHAGSRAYARRARSSEQDVQLAVALEAVGYASSDPGSQRVLDRFEEVFPDLAIALGDNDFRADFIAVVTESASLPSAMSFMAKADSVDLTAHKLRLTARMKVEHRDFHPSDHVSFWDEGYPALLVTDSGEFRNPQFHCSNGQDRSDTLDYPFTTRVGQAVVGMVAERLELR